MKLFHNRYFLLVILISLIPAIPYFITDNLLHTHDGLVHLPRLAAYFKALSEGNIPVRFAGYLNYGYGLPLFNFIYHFPYWIGSIFLIVGFGLVNAFKLSILTSFLLSGVFMYLFANEYFKDSQKALLVTVLYQFAPFHIIELLVRGSYGEVYTYTFLPLVFYGITLLSKKISVKAMLLTSISVFFLIVSHNSVSLLFFGATVLYSFFVSNSRKNLLIVLLSLFYGIILSSFYWLPAVIEHKYTFGDLFMKDLYREHFVSFQNFFIPNFSNLKSLQTGGITTFIGLIQTIGIVATIVLFLKNKKDKRQMRIFNFALLICLISFFFMSPLSRFLWGDPHMGILRQFQFPWRFLSLIVISTAILPVSILYYFKNKNLVVLILCFISIIYVLPFFWGGKYDKIDENYYWNFPLNTTYYGETDVIWSAGPAKKYPKARVEFIDGNGNVKDFVKKNSYQKFRVVAYKNSKLVSHTEYFPGWTVYVNGIKTPIQFQDPNNRGELEFDVPKGESIVLIKFEESKIRFIADIVTVTGIVGLIPLYFIFKKRNE